MRRIAGLTLLIGAFLDVRSKRHTPTTRVRTCMLLQPGALTNATTVTVNEPDARVELQAFRLPAQPTERVVEGIVLWPGGRAAAGGAGITLIGATSERMTTPDGRFRYVLPYGAQYTITVGIGTPNGSAYSSPTTIGRDDRDSRIEIRLRLP